MLKFRRTRSSKNNTKKSGKNRTEDEATSIPPKHAISSRMKKYAPPPPPVQSGSPPPIIPHKVAVISHDPDDSAINELLEGRMELEVILPGSKTVKMTVERKMPMMDLLIQVTSANKISPGGHVIHVVTERSNDIIHYKPSTPIGSLDANTIHVVPKNTVISPPVKKLPKIINQPFEQTFRLQVNLPRSQLAVLRVSPKSTLADIHRIACEDKVLDPSKYDLRHPNRLEESLDQNMTLSQYGMNEVTIVPAYRGSNGNIHHSGSTTDILAIRTKDEEKKKKGFFGFHWKRRSKVSLDSQGEDPNSRGVSPTRSDSSGGGGYTSSDARSTSPNRPVTYHEGMSVSARPNRHISHSKKRPAPPPPPVPSTSQQKLTTQTQKESGSSQETVTTEKLQEKHIVPIVSHSRHSSDSSGYHEASVLSDAMDSMPTTQSSSPTTSLDTETSGQNHMVEKLSPPNMLSRPKSMSCSNVSVASTTAAWKKRRAPAPPPISKGPSSSKTVEDIPSELETAIEQIEECSRLQKSGNINHTTDQEYQEFVFSNKTSIIRTDVNLDEPDRISERTYSLSSQDTLNDIETSFEQTIIAAENMVKEQEAHDICSSSDKVMIKESIESECYTTFDDDIQSEPLHILPQEKTMLQETRTQELSDVTEPGEVFFAIKDEISITPPEQSKSRSGSESSANTCLAADSDCVLSESKDQKRENSELNSNELLDIRGQSKTSGGSFLPESSVDPQINISNDLRPDRYEESATNSEVLGHVKGGSSVTEVEVSSTNLNFHIEPYEQKQCESPLVEPDIETEVSESFRNPKVLSNHFSSMQNLHNCSTDEDHMSSKVEEDVERTMRKVQSEVNLLVGQSKQTEENADLQDQYQKLQKQFLDWQKRLAENQRLLESEHKAIVEKSAVTIAVGHTVSPERAETLPRTSKKSEIVPKSRPIRHRPSVIIGSWSDQKTSVHREYNTKVKIRSDEPNEQKKDEPRGAKLEVSKPSFRISHSKIDTDIFSTSKDLTASPIKTLVRAPVVQAKSKNVIRSFSEEQPRQQPNFERKSPQKTYSVPLPQKAEKPRHPYSLSTWSKLELDDNRPLPVFRKRGVTTNNKGELVVKESSANNSVIHGKNHAIQEAKNRVMEQVKSKVRERSENEDYQNGDLPGLGQTNRAKSLSNGPIAESNFKIQGRQVEAVSNGFASQNYNNGGIVLNGSAHDGNKFACHRVDNVSIPTPPVIPVAPVPNFQRNSNINKLNKSPLAPAAPAVDPLVVVPVIATKRKSRKIIEPKLDAREELMLAIRNFGGRTALRKV